MRWFNIRRIIPMSKYNTDLDYTLPLVDISREELKEIIEEADKIISDNRGNSEELAIAYLKKAQCLQKLDQCRDDYYVNFFDVKKQFEIKELLEKALELSPDMPEALMRLGTTYKNIGPYNDNFDFEGHSNFNKAIDLISRAIQLKPDYAAAFNNRNTMYNTSSDQDEIKKSYR
jgi:tetratricopeptide (TPR) repeat protein